METEKYYGLNEPDKTTTIDSSNIDYNIPGQTTEKLSLNTTNTSILYKASATSNYIKRDNCPVTFTIKKHNDAIMDSSLCVIEIESWTEGSIHKDYVYDLFYTYGTKKQIYLGYEDTNKIFTNKLSSVITTQVTTLDSDTDGCSAKAYLIPNDNTGAPIKFSLNTCTQDRLITFSYKNTPIFKINQTYKKQMTFVVGDVLYSTADEELTLDTQTNGVNNTPIAICVIPDVYENLKNGDESEGGVHTARFVSLNYMNYTTPATGSEEAQSMYFGNYQFTIGNTRGGTTKDSQVGGKWNTQQCLSKATNQDKTSDKVDNNSGIGYCAPACCCDRYSTPGTKSGDWYLPMPGELYELYANKTVINEKRTYIKGSGFIESTHYWSSRESSSDDEYAVYLGNGNVTSHLKNNFDFYVLGFLTLEV